SGFSTPKNPIDPKRVCGGSSGGAAGLTAALDFPHVAIGQSTGGSISCPASFCGVVGLTPTYGLVSRYGLIDYSNSLDKIGPIGKSVWDAALMLSVIAGYDKK
ncbi:MAG: amidase family protein, partial [Candidatus Aenigmatarchaeota archaeon]